LNHLQKTLCNSVVMPPLGVDCAKPHYEGNTMRLEQQFASKIYAQVVGYKDSPDQKQYGSMAYTLPILVRTAGLAQALAFVSSKKKASYDQLLNHLAKVVLDENASGE